MYSKNDLLQNLKDMDINREGTLLVHSSMKSVGEVENRADGVLDALMEYMEPGLLVLPTHTWNQMSNNYPVFDPTREPACVGILPNLFMKRNDVVRSLHPTHSVAATGREAKEFTDGEEKYDTPCPRNGCWGKMYDKKVQILFIGCDLTSNTIIHGAEEWAGIPERLTSEPENLKIVMPDGTIYNRPLYRHYSKWGNISGNYGKMEKPYLYKKIAEFAKFGDANCIIVDGAKAVDMAVEFLKINPDLFIDNLHVPEIWYK